MSEPISREPGPYDPLPCYPVRDGGVATGWAAAVDALPSGPLVLSVDGPAILDWVALVDGVTEVLAQRGVPVQSVAVHDHLAPWSDVVGRTSSSRLRDDPHFEALPTADLRDCFDDLPTVGRPSGSGVVVQYGPGAALLDHDVLWYADLPKRYAEAAVVAGKGSNLGQRDESEPATTRRLFYVDWPLLDRHRDGIADRVDRWIDTQDPARPQSVDGAGLRRTIDDLAEQPFRTRPTFNTTSWGGHWGQRQLGMNPDAPNTALGYELIAPESGVLVGEPSGFVEVPFQMVVAQCPESVLGSVVQAQFGTSFPIRFDYLDTVDGGHLSVHCHPQAGYMREVFGWPYTQHETYYLMVGGPDRKIFLGLHEHVDAKLFHEQAQSAAEHGVPFDIERHVQTFPATPHQLFLVPAGTPHGSAEGNVVLEISATPYLYSLRFYDWLRRDAEGRARPVHVETAFANLDLGRQGEEVKNDLVQSPRTIRQGSGWREELLGTLPEMFFEVRRLELQQADPVPDDTAGRFHVLNVVDGAGVAIETASGYRHDLAYAETLVIPAAVGAYAVRSLGSRPVRLIKALVR